MDRSTDREHEPDLVSTAVAKYHVRDGSEGLEPATAGVTVLSGADSRGQRVGT